jgi:hypothetical protein
MLGCISWTRRQDLIPLRTFWSPGMYEAWFLPMRQGSRPHMRIGSCAAIEIIWFTDAKNVADALNMYIQLQRLLGSMYDDADCLTACTRMIHGRA